MKRTLAVMASFVVLTLVGSLAATAGTVWIEPADQFLGVGQEGSIEVRMEGFPKVWGVEIYLSYDASKVEVLGVEPGGCPAPDFKVYNDFKNGVVRYTVTAVGSGPCEAVSKAAGGSDVFTVKLRRIAAGDAKIAFSAAKPAGISIITDGDVALCDNTTPGCWKSAVIRSGAMTPQTAVD